MEKHISKVIVRGKRGSESLAGLKEKLDRFDPFISYEIEYVDFLNGSNLTVFFSNGKAKTVYSPFTQKKIFEIFYFDE